MVAICNTDNKENNKRLHSYIFAYESILKADLLPSAKVVAQTLVHQGALNECGCCIAYEMVAGFTGLERSAVYRQISLLVKAKIFTRCRKGNASPYTYHFNRNTEEWEVEKYE